MRSADSLAVLLALRRRREEVEERTIADLGRQVLLAEAEVERVRGEIAVFIASRIGETGRVLDGMHHQCSEGRHRWLQQQVLDISSRLVQLKQSRTERMAIYVARRRDREMISELQKQRASAYQHELRAREQKGNQDLFLIRRARN
jgi:hypothetical protein